MRWRSILSCAAAVVGLALLGAVPTTPDPNEIEVRDFAISVDGKPAGEFRMRIAPGDGGRTHVALEADVRVKYLLKTYRYTFRGAEVWQGDRLERARATVDDDGKRTTVEAETKDNQMQVAVNGRTRTSAPVAGTTTYWRLPPYDARTPTVSLLDIDTGADVQGRLQAIEKATLMVGNAEVRCVHYRITGGVQAELWFDEQNRLVRQQAVEDGHPTEWRLIGVRRERAR
jgi:hypothetical protein